MKRFAGNLRLGRHGLRLGLGASLLLSGAGAVAAETLFICWQGNGGYSMTGRFSYPDSLSHRPIITQLDVTEFEIMGYFEGRYIGSWDLSMLESDTSWLLRYDTRRGIFPLKGYGVYQMWNASGAVNDCGSPGFGFNAGNGGQDVCIDDTYIITSTIDWDTLIITGETAPTPDCSGENLLGALVPYRSADEAFRG